MTKLQPFDRITSDPDIMNGKPCIRGMRTQVSLVLNLVANGMTTKEIIKAFPYIESEDISECLRYAAWLAEDRIEGLRWWRHCICVQWQGIRAGWGDRV